MIGELMQEQRLGRVANGFQPLAPVRAGFEFRAFEQFADRAKILIHLQAQSIGLG